MKNDDDVQCGCVVLMVKSPTSLLPQPINLTGRLRSLKGFSIKVVMYLMYCFITIKTSVLDVTEYASRKSTRHYSVLNQFSPMQIMHSDDFFSLLFLNWFASFFFA